MRVRAVVVDYDGTIAGDQAAFNHPGLAAAFRTLREAGVLVVLNTGRDMDYTLGELGLSTPKDVAMFDAMIFEGGGLVWFAGELQPRPLTKLYSPELVQELRRVKVPADEIWTGHCAVMTSRTHSKKVDRAIANVNARRSLAGRSPLLLELTQNRNSITYLPPGINKGTALIRVLSEHFHIPTTEILGAGDGTNDIAFLSLCGAAVVPVNGHPRVKSLRNAIHAKGENADGLVEVLREVIRNGMQIKAPDSAIREVA